MKKNTFLAIALAWGCGIQAQNTFPASGNVGIGTTTPASNLEVRGSSNPSLRLTTVVGATAPSLLWGMSNCNGCYTSHAIPGDAVFKLQGSSNLYFTMNTSAESNSRSITFADEDQRIMRIWNGGKVQIGNVSMPGTYRLYVESGILTERVKVAIKTTADWADHVFQEKYNLMPLETIGRYIQQHKHLPGIPSAADMVKEGNDLGKTDARLLEKIEELTLYLLQVNDRLSQVEKENTALKTLIQQQKK